MAARNQVWCNCRSFSVAAIASGMLACLPTLSSAADDGSRAIMQVRANASTLDVRPLIETLTEQIGEVRETLRQRDAAPEPSTFTVWDRDHYQDELNDLLDDALRALLPDTYSTAREQLLTIDDAVTLGGDEWSDLRIEHGLATVETGTPSLLDRVRGRDVASGSKAALAEQIEAMESELASIRRERSAVLGEFASTMNESFRFTLSPAQAEALLLQANGSSIVEARMLIETLVAMERQIAELMRLDLSPNVQQRYRGLTAVNRLLIVRLYQRHLEDYDTDWLSRLQTLRAEVEADESRAQSALGRQEAAAHTEAVVANQRVNRAVLDTVNRYEDILRRRRDITEESLRKAEIDARVAIDTLRTLERAASVSGLISTSFEEFQALSEIEVPDLIPLDEGAVSEEFLNLSRQMVGS